MLKRFMQQWLLGTAVPPPPHARPACVSDAAPADRSAPSPLAGPTPPLPGRRFVELSLASLLAQRQAQDRLQRNSFEELQGLQADCQGMVARYAAARLAGRPTELQALERMYANLETRLEAAELRHADQLRVLTLLDRVCVLREDLQARNGLQQDTLAGLGVDDLKQMMGDELAMLMHNRDTVQSLLDDLADNDVDARLQGKAALAPVRERLMALTEPEVQCGLTAQLSPMDALASRVEQGLPPQGQARRQGGAAVPGTQQEGL